MAESEHVGIRDVYLVREETTKESCWDKLLCDLPRSLLLWVITAGTVVLLGFIFIPGPEHARFGHAFCVKTSPIVLANNVPKAADANLILVPEGRKVTVWDAGGQHAGDVILPVNDEASCGLHDGFSYDGGECRKRLGRHERIEFELNESSHFFVRAFVSGVHDVPPNNPRLLDGTEYANLMVQVANTRGEYDKIREIVNCEF